MKIVSVSIKGFFRYGPIEQTFLFPNNGITLVNGRNACGKTSLLTSIIWCLYNRSKQDAADDVINRYCKEEGCKVSLKFIGDDGCHYEVIRYRGHPVHNNKVYVFKEGKDISCKNASDTNALIVDICKINYQAFVNSVILSSEMYEPFLISRESDRLGIFESILDLKELTLFYTETKSILKDLNSKRDEILLQKSAKEAELTILANTLSSYKTRAKEELLKLKNQNDSLKAKIENLQKENEEYSYIDVESEKAKLKNISIKEQLENSLREINDDISKVSFTYNEDTYLVRKKFLASVEDFNYEEAVSLLKKKEEILKKKSELESSIDETDYSKELKFVEEKIQKINDKIIELDNELKTLESNKCPYCGHEMESEQITEKVSSINKKKDLLNEELSNLNKEQIEIADKKANAETNNENIIKQINELPEVQIKFDNPDLLKEKIVQAKDIIEVFEKEKVENTEKLENLNSKKSDLEEKIKGLELSKYTEEFLNNISDKISENEKAIQECENTISVNNGKVSSVYSKEYIKETEGVFKENKEALDAILKSMDDINDDIKHYEYLAECFSNKSGGFKKYFIGEMIDVFNDKINKFLPFFFSEKVEINFDRNLTETIKMDDEQVSFASFSKGQKTRAELAISFALFELARIFFGNDCNFLVIDEIIDLGLDSNGITAAVNVLKSFAEENTVFLISHNQDVKDLIDDVITIERDSNGFSVIKR